MSGQLQGGEARPDFTLMTLEQLDEFCVEHRSEFDAAGLEPGEVARRVRDGKAAIDAVKSGFTVVTLGSPDSPQPHLWLVFVDEAARRRGVGRELVRAAVRKHSAEYHMTLSCLGANRRAFFGRLGFRVASRDGDWRSMTTNPDRR